MALRTTYSAEDWSNVYKAFEAINFVAYDFDTIKQSLVDYTRIYYPERFNDYTQSSEYIALLEMFAYIAEQLAYRVDMVSHENFITTAQRKQSILRLAKLISYKATRNIPVRGLVKLTSITTSERVVDSRGIDLSGLTIIWNDPNNSNWKEQFILVMDRVLSSKFGQPQKSVQIDDVVMDLYSLSNDPALLKNGVFSYSVSTGLETFPMELVPADIDESGPLEREPDQVSSMSIVYANDGIGDGSDYTGFLMFTKQGVLTKIDYEIKDRLPDRRVEFLPQNINHTDVWVQKLNQDGSIAERWKQVDTVSEQNLIFNDIRATRKKFEVDSRENDQIAVIFGDGDFSDAPQGSFRFWMRQSANRSLVIQKNKIVNEPFGFNYTSSIGNKETCSVTFSLTSTLQNGSGTETIEHIRRAAPATYYAQNRMVNGQDYNTYLLKDPSILRLKTINRTFAGQPKYIDWNDASGQYENVKLFGDDLVMRYQLELNTITTSSSGKSLIDEIIEPLLKTPGVVNTMMHISAGDDNTYGIVSPPRRQFIEDNRGSRYKEVSGALIAVAGGSGDGSLKEKTAMQGLIDRHWYGDPLDQVLDANGVVLGVIPDPGLHPEDDSRIYESSLPRTVDGINRYPPGDIGSGLQPVAEQDYFGIRYNRLMKHIGNGSIAVAGQSAFDTSNGTRWVDDEYWLKGEVWTIEVQADGGTIDVRSNIRGVFPTGKIGALYEIQPQGFSTSVPMFIITPGSIPFVAGDAFILDTIVDNLGVAPNGTLKNGYNQKTGFPRSWGDFPVNLNGWWEIIDATAMPDFATSLSTPQLFTTSTQVDVVNLKQYSWVIAVRKIRQSSQVIGFEVHSRDLKLSIESKTTKFWYNSVDQMLDPQTKKRVYDNIKILGSNLDTTGKPLRKNQIYDVVGAVTDKNGVADVNKLEIVPSDMLQENSSGDLSPDRMLQFETFSANSYEYFRIDNPTVIFDADPSPDAWAPAATSDNTCEYGRNLRMPELVQSNPGLDFMWQHFSPFTNIIDPSVSNIHDAYVMSRGYYDNVINYVRGNSTSAPTPPTPLELRNSYGYLLENKMLSDSVVLHPGKLRMLFGGLAEPQLRAKFKVVKSPLATLTNERIKEEILNVINTYFDIDNWDFGDTFYATELISLIHQRLPADVASVVLVPLYSTNSFGSMFTVYSGIDEILQSACELSDIDIVEALTPTVIRQVR